MIKNHFVYPLVLTSALFPYFSLAATKIPDVVISMHASATYSVPETKISVSLGAQGTARSAAQAAYLLNQKILWAENQLSRSSQIHWHLTGYNSQSVKKKWIVSGNLRVTGAPSVVFPITANLQSRLQVSHLHFYAPAKAIRLARTKAQGIALRNFRKQGEAVCQDLGLSWLGIRSVQLGWSAPVFPHPWLPRPMVMMARAVPAPIERGNITSTTGKVTVSGTVLCRNP